MENRLLRFYRDLGGNIAAARQASGMTQAELAAATFVRYKGAQAGEIDWRPTETIPEDYYAL